MSKATSATNTASVQNARKKLTKFLKTLETVPTEILEIESARIYAEAKKETPYKSGTLENSVYVRVARDKRRPGIVAGASARHKNYNYAGIQHENMKYRHPIKGKHHFIRDPFNRGILRIKRRFLNEIKLR